MAANRLQKDPICGMAVTTQSPHATAQDGATVYFCGAHCRAKFLASPASYSSPAGIDQSSVATGNSVTASAIFTCPMHQQIH